MNEPIIAPVQRIANTASLIDILLMRSIIGQNDSEGKDALRAIPVVIPAKAGIQTLPRHSIKPGSQLLLG